MKAVRMRGNGQVEVVEAADPKPKDDLVVVKIMSSTICGTEHTAYHGPSALPIDGGSGHEGAGTVVDTDSRGKIAVGDHVSIYPTTSENCGRCPECSEGQWLHCRAPRPKRSYMGTHSQYMLAPERLCLPVPSDMSFDVCAMLDDCLGTPYKAIRRLGVGAADTVLITGAGPIGAAAAVIAGFLNARTIVADINDYRLARASDCGVDHTFNPDREDVLAKVRELTDGRGVDVAIDCSGLEVAQLQCLDAARAFGRVAFLGIKSEQTTVKVVSQFILKELTVIGSWASTPMEHFELIDLIQRGMPVEQLITHRYGIDDASTAFESFFSGEAVKVAINPW